MNLTEQPEKVTWPGTHYVFVERTGPFQNTAPQAWKDFHRLLPEIAEPNEITGFMSLYKMGPKIYRAGVSLAAPPVGLPKGLEYEEFLGGRYSRLTLTGPYSLLPEASGHAWQIVSKMNLKLRDDFAIEHYVNDPKTTPEEQLITEILIPTV